MSERCFDGPPGAARCGVGWALLTAGLEGAGRHNDK